MVIAARTLIAEGRLRHFLAAGRRRALERQRPVLVSLAEQLPALDPLDTFARAAGLPLDRCFWEHAPSGLSMAGVGCAHAIVTSADRRFAAAGTAWRALLQGAVLELPEQLGAGVGPLLLGGFAFDPQHTHAASWDGYPDGLLTLPRLLLAATPAGCWLTLNAVLYPDSEVDAEAAALLGICSWLLAPLQGAAGAEGSAQAKQEIAAAPLPRLQAGGEHAPVPEDLLPAAAWQALVARTARDIRAGRFEKVVLARQARIQLPGGDRAEPTAIDPAATLARLRVGYPSAFLFAVARGGDAATAPSCFLGATPERLVRLQGDRVEATCLAGSIRRGATPAEDEALGRVLLASEKDRIEHEVVAHMLREALNPLCDDVRMPEPPRLLRVKNVQHLHTPITGRLRADGRRVGPRPSGAVEDLTPGQGLAAGAERTICILDLVERLHPTPAVGGYPRAEALAAIREREGFDRGWYAGPVGWVDRAGNGEFAVGIRSALLRGAEATLFAGCGIVGDSDPESEYAESCLKLQAMLSALAPGE